MRLAWLLIVLPLSGCSAAPPLAGAILGYVASLNSVGAAYLKFSDDQKSCQAPVEIQPVQIVTLETVNP